MNKLRVSLCVAVGCATSWALVNAYHVEPRTAAMSGWTRLPPSPSYFVSEVLTCNFDSLSYVELFAGAKGNGGAYRVGVWLDGSEIMWSNGTQTQNESWVRFDNWNTQVAFPKGKRLTIKFTRSGGDSIRYYYDHSDPYKFGEMPNDIDPNPADLCMRVYGRMNAVDSADWCSSPSSLTTAA